MRGRSEHYRTLGLCGAPSAIEGAHPCPRKESHRGEHYWWIDWVDGAGRSCVIVYSGEGNPHRVKRCRGRFSSEPKALDVHRLILQLAPLKRREVARRTPESEPAPATRTMTLKARRVGWARRVEEAATHG